MAARSKPDSYTFVIPLVSIAVVIVVITIILVSYSFVHAVTAYANDSSDVPKIIWTYWNNSYGESPDVMPEVIERCIMTWRHYNPQWQIVILNNDNIRSYTTPSLERLYDHPAMSSLLRLQILSEHGGVWADPSIIMTQGLDWVLSALGAQGPEEARKGFLGYYFEQVIGLADRNKPPLENWFLACTRGHPFVRRWRDELRELLNIETDLVIPKAHKELNEILHTYIAAQRVFIHSPKLFLGLVLLRAEDGPFKYLVEADWNSEAALLSVCSTSLKALADRSPIIRLRRNERDALHQNPGLHSCLINRLVI